VPAGHRGRRRHDGAVWVDHCVVVVDDANDVDGVIVGVLDVPTRVVALWLVVETINERSRAECRLVGEAEVISCHGSLGGGEGLELSVGQPDGVKGKATNVLVIYL